MKIFILPILKFIWVTLCLIFTYLMYTFTYILWFLWFFKLPPKEWETSTKRLSMSPYQKDLESGFIYRFVYAPYEERIWGIYVVVRMYRIINEKLKLK